jgi:hypothetical protein
MRIQGNIRRALAMGIAAGALAGGFAATALSALAIEGSDQQKPPQPPPGQSKEVSPCQHDCYFAFGECNKAAGDDQDKRLQCKADGNACLGKCHAAPGSNATGEKKPKPVPPCHAECYRKHGECTKAAGDDQEKRLQCKEEGNTCLASCPAATDQSGAAKKGMDKSYEEAVKAAKQRFLDGQRKLLDEYTAALEKAWAARP